MILLPSDKSLSILWYRDFVQQATRFPHLGFSFLDSGRCIFALSRGALLELSIQLLYCAVDEDPVWETERGILMGMAWRGPREDGLQDALTLSKPFYDTPEVEANLDEEFETYYTHLTDKIVYGHVPNDKLRGLSTRSCPKEYHIIYKQVREALVEYKQRKFPWFLTFHTRPSGDHHLLFLSTTSALYLSLKALELAYISNKTSLHMPEGLSIYKLSEGFQSEWLQKPLEDLKAAMGIAPSR